MSDEDTPSASLELAEWWDKEHARVRKILLAEGFPDAPMLVRLTDAVVAGFAHADIEERAAKRREPKL